MGLGGEYFQKTLRAAAYLLRDERLDRGERFFEVTHFLAGRMRCRASISPMRRPAAGSSAGLARRGFRPAGAVGKYGEVVSHQVWLAAPEPGPVVLE